MKLSIPAVSSFSSFFLASLLLALALIAIPAAGFAQTGDGQPPSQESVCDDLQGAAFGICNAYCEATDCGDGVNYADMRACAALQRNWQRRTGLIDLPCDCGEGEVIGEDGSCVCAYDLVIEINGFDNSCPTGPGSCVFEADIEVANIGTENITEPFDAVVTALGVSESANFPGLNAGAVDGATISIPTGDNCFDPNCEVEAIVDFTDEILECDETNNRDAEIFLG